MEKISTRHPKGKAPLVTKRDQVYMGLDVHKLSVHAAVRFNGKLFGSKVLSASAKALASKTKSASDSSILCLQHA